MSYNENQLQNSVAVQYLFRGICGFVCTDFKQLKRFGILFV